MSATKIVGDRYIVSTYIGKGGFSKVYQAYDTKTSSLVAIKKIKVPPTLKMTKMLQEIEILEKISKHPNCDPNILCIYDHVVEGNKIYIITEFIRGEPIKPEKMSFTTALFLSKEIAAAFAFLHEKGIVHRDIKPDNILVTKDGIKIIDFGMSCDILSKIGRCSGVLGTPNYVDPEIIKKNINAKNLKKSDVYSFGTLMFFMFNGQLPYYGGNMKREEFLQKKLLEDPKISDSGNELIDKIINMSLNKDPSKRPSMKIILKKLKEI